MFNRQAVGAIVIALALPAFADSPPELTHRLEQYQEMVHRLNQYPEVIAAGHTHAVDPWKNKIHTVEQHSGSDVVELQSLSNSAISFRMTANADAAYKTIGKLAGVSVVIDPDFRPQKITLVLTNVTAREALDAVALQSKTVWRAVTPNIIFVYPKDAR